MGWGIAHVGRLSLSEQYTLAENHNAGTGEKTVALSGQHYTGWKGITTAGVQRMQEDVAGLADRIVPVYFDDKADQNGYYQVHDVNISALNWERSDGVVSFDWSFILRKFGPDNAHDLETRFAAVVRTNPFSLTGTRWQAPPGGHYAYYTGSSLPSGTVSRASEDGAIVTYLGIPANISPRWGCAVANYGLGRVRLKTDSQERVATGMRASATGWELSNGLVRITPLSSGGMLSIDSWGGSAWETKAWNLAKGGATTALGTFDAMSVIRNDYEMITIRLMKSGSPGRTLADISLRRGSRFAEIYLQTDTSTTLGAFLQTTEPTTDNTLTGYVVATSNDADGNKAIVGSATAVSYTSGFGLSKAAVTALDLYIGSVVGGTGAASGDSATNLRDQYIAAISESTWVVKR